MVLRLNQGYMNLGGHAHHARLAPRPIVWIGTKGRWPERESRVAEDQALYSRSRPAQSCYRGLVTGVRIGSQVLARLLEGRTATHSIHTF